MGSAVMICCSCSRGMLPDVVCGVWRCYVCRLEIDKRGRWSDITPFFRWILRHDDVLHALRAECKWETQQVVAGRLGISPQYLSDIMRGKRSLPSSIARYYGLQQNMVYIPQVEGDA